MRAKRVGADTFECPLIFVCQIIDIRVVVLRHLEHVLRKNPARPMARCRRRGWCGWRGLRRRPGRNKAGSPRPELVFRNAKSCGDFLQRLAGKASISNQLKLPDYTEFYTFIEPNFGKSFFARQPWQKGIAREDLAGPTYKGGSSQHPEDDPSGGEGLIKAVYEAIRRSPVWNTSLLVIVYDEHGGFYDSVKPGRAVPPGDLPPRGQPALNSRGFDFSHYGVRVPAVVVSPLIPKGKVDPTVYDHASILATLERLLGMGPLTKRDARANDVLHLLTESTPRTDCPTTLASPARPNRGGPVEELKAGIAALGHAVQDIAGEAERAVEGVRDAIEGLADEPLPNSGNIIGFLHVLLKTELECAKMDGQDEDVQALIYENFKRIDTHGKAQAYVKAMAEKIEIARKARPPA